MIMTVRMIVIVMTKKADEDQVNKIGENGIQSLWS